LLENESTISYKHLTEQKQKVIYHAITLSFIQGTPLEKASIPIGQFSEILGIEADNRDKLKEVSEGLLQTQLRVDGSKGVTLIMTKSKSSCSTCSSSSA